MPTPKTSVDTYLEPSLHEQSPAILYKKVEFNGLRQLKKTRTVATQTLGDFCSLLTKFNCCARGEGM